MQLDELDVSAPDSVELARTLNDIGVLHYLQNNTASVLQLLTVQKFVLLILFRPVHFWDITYTYLLCPQKLCEVLW